MPAEGRLPGPGAGAPGNPQDPTERIAEFILGHELESLARLGPDAWHLTWVEVMSYAV